MELIKFELGKIVWGKRSYISFRALSPETKKLERCRIYVDRYKNNKKFYARIALDELNKKLIAGWNPFTENKSAKSLTKLTDALDVVLDLKMRYIRSSSKVNYKSRIKFLKEWIISKKLKDLYVSEFTSDLAIEFMDYLMTKNKTGPKTYNNYIVDYRNFFNTLIQRNYIKKNPFSVVKYLPEKQTNKRYFTDHELSIYKKYLQEHDPHFLAISGLTYYCAIRPKEICLLKISDIDLNNHLITVNSDVSKNKKNRFLPIPNVFMKDLKTYIALQPKSHYLVSYGMIPGPKPIKPTRIAEHFSKIRTLLGLSSDLYFYSLKDTCAERMLKAGFTIKDVRDLFGHSSIAVTDAYLKRIKTIDKKFIENFPVL